MSRTLELVDEHTRTVLERDSVAAKVDLLRHGAAIARSLGAPRGARRLERQAQALAQGQHRELGLRLLELEGRIRLALADERAAAERDFIGRTMIRWWADNDLDSTAAGEPVHGDRRGWDSHHGS